MACGETFRRVREILIRDPARKYAIVSAPGKRFGGERKVTDLLYAAHKNLLETGSLGAPFEKIKTRIRGVSDELNLKSLDVDALLFETEQNILQRQSEAFTVSRGEYLSAKLFSAFWGAPFLDAKDLIVFQRGGTLDAEASYRKISAALKENERAVIPGFYGADEQGEIVLFSRGGSDISGAVVARGAKAELYENWTDVSGFLVCDPRIVENPERIGELTYGELRALSYMGASVLHIETLFPVREAGIPILIKNVFRPTDPGTMIVKERKSGEGTVTGIAGKKGYVGIGVEKTQNGEPWWERQALLILEKYGVPLERMPSGMDARLFLVESGNLKGGKLKLIQREFEETLNPDRVQIFPALALVSAVGQGMKSSVGASARVFRAVAKTGVNIRLIDQGPLGQDLVFGVDEADFERTVRAVYEEFFKGE